MTLKKERRPSSPRLVALRLHGGMAVEQEVCNFTGLTPNTSATSKSMNKYIAVPLRGYLVLYPAFTFHSMANTIDLHDAVNTKDALNPINKKEKRTIAG